MFRYTCVSIIVQKSSRLEQDAYKKTPSLEKLTCVVYVSIHVTCAFSVHHGQFTNYWRTNRCNVALRLLKPLDLYVSPPLLDPTPIQSKKAKRKKKRAPSSAGQCELGRSLGDKIGEVGGDASPVGPLTPAQRRAMKTRARARRLDQAARKKEEACRDARLAELDKTDGATTFSLKVRWCGYVSFVFLIGDRYTGKPRVPKLRHAVS